jgi:hypothetical protein
MNMLNANVVLWCAPMISAEPRKKTAYSVIITSAQDAEETGENE